MMVDLIDLKGTEPWSWLITVDGVPYTVILNQGTTPDVQVNHIEKANPGREVELIRLGRAMTSYSRLSV
jgi:hypothetical protein